MVPSSPVNFIIIKNLVLMRCMNLANTRRWIALSMLLGGIMGSPTVLAQGLPSVPLLPARTVLTLEEAVDKVLGSSPELRVFRAEIGVAEGEVTTSRLPSRFNPGVAVEAGPRLNTANGGALAEAAITVTQELERPQRRAAREQAAGLGVQVEQNRLDAVRLRVASRIQTLYAQFWLSEQLLQLTIEREQLAQNLLVGLQERFNIGDIGLIPVNLAQVELSQARASRERQNGEAEATRAGLLVAIGDTPERAVQPINDLPETPDILPALPRVFELALEANPSLLAAQIAQQRAEAQLQLARAEATPNLTPTVTYRQEGPESILLAGLIFPLTIFNRNQGLIAIAESRQTQTFAQRDLQQLELRQQIEEAYARYVASQRVLLTYSSETISAIERNQSLLDEAFRSGKTGVTEILLARRDAIAVQASILQARTDLFTSFVLLQNATGGRL